MTVVNDIKLYTRTFLRNSTIGFAQKLGQLNIQGINRSISHITDGKFVKASVSVLRLAAFLPLIGGLFNDFVKAMEQQKDVYYAAMSVGAVVSLQELKKKWKGPIPAICTVLNAIGTFCDTLKFMKKYGLAQFELLSQLGTKLGSLEVSFHVKGVLYTSKPFESKPLNLLLNDAKAFFILSSSLIALAHSGWKFLFEGNSPQEKKEIRLKELSIENLIKQACNIGKIYLIMATNCHTIIFRIADVFVQVFALVNSDYLKTERIA